MQLTKGELEGMVKNGNYCIMRDGWREDMEVSVSVILTLLLNITGKKKK